MCDIPTSESAIEMTEEGFEYEWGFEDERGFPYECACFNFSSSSSGPAAG